MNLTKQYFKYVSQNIFGLLGTSCYILADTYFISQAAGTDGVTLLNLCLPIYNLIFDRPWLGHPVRHPAGAGRRAGTAVFFQRHLLGLHPVGALFAGGAFLPGSAAPADGRRRRDRGTGRGVYPHLPAVHAVFYVQLHRVGLYPERR